MTTRERKEARIERLREGVAKRKAQIAAINKLNEPYRNDYVLATQPGHIPERARVNRRDEKAWKLQHEADDMRRRADGLEQELRKSIYDDDPDVIERLTERIEALEAKRKKWKAENLAYMLAHPEVKKLRGMERKMAVPHSMDKLSTEIRSNRQRLERLTEVKVVVQPMHCPHCGSSDTRYFRRRWECWDCGKEGW